MMHVATAATIKLFLLFGDPKRLRTGEISNWSGKALAAPRTDLDQLLARPELLQSGVYLLTGTDPDSGKPMAYIGEAEVISDRLKSHKDKDFWVSALCFVSKDKNITKGHTRYLEGRLISEAIAAGRFRLANTQQSGARLPESDESDMEVFLGKVRQLLPVLGSDILVPAVDVMSASETTPQELICDIKGLRARGRRTPSGFIVLEGSQAVVENRPSASIHPYIPLQRKGLLEDGALRQEKDHLVFTKSLEFSSPSMAAAVIHGGAANGLTAWKDASGRTLKEVESS